MARSNRAIRRRERELVVAGLVPAGRRGAHIRCVRYPDLSGADGAAPSAVYGARAIYGTRVRSRSTACTGAPSPAISSLIAP